LALIDGDCILFGSYRIFSKITNMQPFRFFRAWNAIRVWHVCNFVIWSDLRSKLIYNSFYSLIYFTDYVSGGELFTHLYQRERFTVEQVRIYIGEIILALEHLHKVGCFVCLLRVFFYLYSFSCLLIVAICPSRKVFTSDMWIIWFTSWADLLLNFWWSAVSVDISRQITINRQQNWCRSLESL
jgi:serine/threonine protein kinase